MCRRLSLLPFHVTMQITCAFLGSTECNRSLLSLTEYKKKILQKMQRWTPLYVLLTASSLFLLILSRGARKNFGVSQVGLETLHFYLCTSQKFPLQCHSVSPEHPHSPHISKNYLKSVVPVQKPQTSRNILK